MMLVRETIHHGHYHNERVVECPDDAADALTLLGASSPYPFTFTASNRFMAQAAVDLATHGRCEFGWAQYDDIADGRE